MSAGRDGYQVAEPAHVRARAPGDHAAIAAEGQAKVVAGGNASDEAQRRGHIGLSGGIVAPGNDPVAPLLQREAVPWPRRNFARIGQTGGDVNLAIRIVSPPDYLTINLPGERERVAGGEGGNVAQRTRTGGQVALSGDRAISGDRDAVIPTGDDRHGVRQVGGRCALPGVVPAPADHAGLRALSVSS